MIHSLSSHLITKTTITRNPQGDESNWLKYENIPFKSPSLKALLKADLSYKLIAVVAAVETAIAGIFTVLAIPTAIISKRILNNCVQWLESSSFSIIWALAYQFFNYTEPNLLTKENLSRNYVFRGDIQSEPCKKWKKAPLSSSIFMLQRELPEYLSVAYKIRFNGNDQETGKFARFKGKIQRYRQLIKEISGRQLHSSFQKNAKRLNDDFAKLNTTLEKSNRPLCAYFVSKVDHNGAILGTPVYYYHHYKIEKLNKHFDVSAKVVNNTAEIFEHLKNLKNQFPDRPIKVVDIVAHGSDQEIEIPSENHKNYRHDDVKYDEFKDCAPDADIILDACSVGSGSNSIAEKIANNNPGKKVFAPGAPLYFSKPSFTGAKGKERVAHVTHGFAAINAYTSRVFLKVA